MPEQPLLARPRSDRNPSRARRTVLTLAAAAVVVLLPTACDYAVATTGSSAGSGSVSGGGHSGGHGGAAPVTEIDTVPAGAVEELPPTAAAPADPGADDADGGAEATDAPEATGDADPTDAAEAIDDADATDAAEATGDAEVTDAAEATSAAEVTDAAEATGDAEATDGVEATTEVAAPVAAPVNNGLAILGDDCTNSGLEPHDGFQAAPRCVAIAFGEVAAAAQSPSLLITQAPATVGTGEDFTLTVSTRNLIRDRFLGAAAGGYYRESSFLNADGLQRGHFHTACRFLESTDVAPDAAPAPEFFLATQDNGGSAAPDQVVIPVTGLDGAGTAQCAVWAGDGSHRLPMMERANQTPAFDIVRITVG